MTEKPRFSLNVYYYIKYAYSLIPIPILQDGFKNTYSIFNPAVQNINAFLCKIKKN